MNRFRKLTEREAFRGHVISVVVAEFETPSGDRFEREIVRHPGAVSMVPVIGDDVLLVRQYRTAVERELLEIPAGKRDVAGESPEQTARRELEEEVGMRAGRLEQLAELHMTPGFSDERMTIFMALDLEPRGVTAHGPAERAPASRTAMGLGSAAPDGIEEEHMTIERVALEDAPALIADGTVADAKSIIGLLLAREALR